MFLNVFQPCHALFVNASSFTILNNSLKSSGNIVRSAKFHSYGKRDFAQFKERIPFLPPNIQFALNFFEKSNLIFNDGVMKLINAYRKVKSKFDQLDKKQRTKKYALIAVEGLDGCGKSVVGKRVAFNIGAEYRISPSDIIKQIRAQFEDASLSQRAAYYTIGNYIVAMELFPMLSMKHVILDRYWHSTSAFHISEAVRRDTFFPLPPAGDKIYQWPRDLLKPDAVLFFNVTEELRIKRHCNRGTTNTNQEQLLESSPKFRNTVLTAYDRMFDPQITKINADPPILDVAESIERKIAPILDKYRKQNEL